MTQTHKAKNSGLRTRLLAALAVLTSCIFLTGLSMPDTPPPQRHAKPRVQTFAEEQPSQGKKQAKVKQTRSAPQKAEDNASSLESNEVRAKHKQVDRSARTVLPSKKLR